LRHWPQIRAFLTQDCDTAATLAESREALFDLVRAAET
jgi:hypothetical protein